MEINKKTIKRLSKKQKIVHDYLRLLDIQKEDLKIETIAKEAGVGYSTVYSYINKLGYKNFKDFHKAALLSTTSATKRDLNDLDGMFNFYIDTLKISKELVDNKYRLVSEKILNANNIFVIGFGSQAFVAREMENRLFRFGLQVKLASSDVVTQRMQVSMLKKNDIVMLISLSGMTPEAILLLQLTKEFNLDSILITSNKNSIAAKYSNLVLECSNTTLNEEYEYSISPMLPTLIAIDVITKYLLNNKNELLEKRKKTNEILNMF